MNQLVSTEWLEEHIDDSDLIIADVRWVNLNSAAAHAEFVSGHIPGAVFVDLDSDLSEIGDYSKGRHPLPDPQTLATKLSRKGIGKGKRVIATEAESFKLAARLWWVLRWIGVDEVCVLDGGFAKWKAEGRAIETQETNRAAVAPFEVQLRKDLMVDADGVARRIGSGGLVFDARAQERFRGETEPLDKRAGHIEGAWNIPLTDLVTGNPPQLKSREELRMLFQHHGINESKTLTSYCGSGVTACQLLWALAQAGYGKLQLYPGSWSEWIELHPDAGVKLT